MNDTPQDFTTADLARRIGQWIRAVHQRVRVARTIHALPFTAIGAVLARNTWPAFGELVLVIFCVVFGRATLVALVRFFEAPLDVANPGVSGRAPTDPPPRLIWSMFALHGAVILVFCAYLLNDLSGHLSWMLLGGMLLYALLRRYTALSHLLLGVALAATPLGAFIALRGELPQDPLGFTFLSGGIIAWVAGFDMVYGLYLREHQGGEAGRFLRPLTIQPESVLRVARMAHLAAVVLFMLTGPAFGLSAVWHVGPGIALGLLVVAHHGLTPSLTAAQSGRYRACNLSVGPVLLLAALLSV